MYDADENGKWIVGGKDHNRYSLALNRETKLRTVEESYKFAKLMPI